MPIRLRHLPSRLHRLCAIVCAAAPLAFAAETASIEEVVITGTRMETPADKLPSSLTILDAESIESRGAAGVVDLLRGVEGVHVSQPGGRGGVASLFLRGAEPNFTTVLIDGIRVNDPNNTRGGSYDFSTVTVDEIERVEIVRGPQSSVYGSDALAGVVNLITRRPSTQTSRSIQLETGEDDLFRGQLALRGSLLPRQSYSVGYAHDDDGEPVEGSKYRSDTAWLSLDGTLGAATQYGVAGRVAQTDTHSFPEDSGGPDLAVIRATDSARNDETALGAHAEHPWSNAWLSRVTVNYYTRDDDISSPGVAPGVRDGVPPTTSDNNLDRAAAQFLTQFSGTALRVAVGADVRDEDGKSTGVISFAPGFDLPTAYEIDRRDVGAFVEGDYEYSDAIMLRASIRTDSPDDANVVTSPQVGAIVSLPDETRLHLNWGEGFKLPSFFALAHPLVGNPNLQPESVTSVDAGVTREFGDAVSVQAFVFRSEYENLIDFDPLLFTSVNRSKVTIEGFEAALVWRPWPDTEITGEATRTQIDVKPTGTLRQRPDWRGSVNVRQPLGPAWYVNANLLMVDRVFDSSIPTGPQNLDGYTRLDVNAAWQISSALRVTFALDNALDENYEEAIGFPSPGRRARVTLGLDF